MKEHAVQIVVIVLTGMRQYLIEILASFVDDSRQANDLRGVPTIISSFSLPLFLNDTLL